MKYEKKKVTNLHFDITKFKDVFEFKHFTKLAYNKLLLPV